MALTLSSWSVSVPALIKLAGKEVWPGSCMREPGFFMTEMPLIYGAYIVIAVAHGVHCYADVEGGCVYDISGS